MIMAVGYLREPNPAKRIQLTLNVVRHYGLCVCHDTVVILCNPGAVHLNSTYGQSVDNASQ